MGDRPLTKGDIIWRARFGAPGFIHKNGSGRHKPDNIRARVASNRANVAPPVTLKDPPPWDDKGGD